MRFWTHRVSLGEYEIGIPVEGGAVNRCGRLKGWSGPRSGVKTILDRCRRTPNAFLRGASFEVRAETMQRGGVVLDWWPDAAAIIPFSEGA